MVNKLLLTAAAVLLTVHYTGTAWSASVLPNTVPELRALEENRSAATDASVVAKTEKENKPLPSLEKFYLSTFKFSSSDVVDQAALSVLLSDYCAREVSFADLQQAAETVTKYYRNRGHLVAVAYFPRQEITAGIVEMKILLGSIDSISIDNQSRLRLPLAQTFLKGVQVGGKVHENSLVAALNNLNDLPGITAAGILEPGHNIGGTELTVVLKSGQPVENIIYTDNYGGKYAGRYRYGMQTIINEPFRNGDKFVVGGMLSNEAMKNYSFVYEAPLAASGSRLGISFGRTDYTLGDYFDLIGAVGTARTLGLYGSTPLINQTGRKVNFIYGYDKRHLTDELRLFGSSKQKSSDTFHWGLAGHDRTKHSYTGYSAVYYQGMMHMDNAEAQADNKYSDIEGAFSKITTDINHIRRLGNVTDLHLNFHNQLTNRNLDGSEQFYLGGANGVRAYPQGEAGGDSGYQATAELRYATSVPGLSLAVFTDIGEVQVRKDGQLGDNHRKLAGWGLGIQYARVNDFFLRVDYARKIDGEAYRSESEDSDGRLWFQAYKLF